MEDIRDFVYYDETSQTFLRWKRKHARKVVKDAPAGYYSEGNDSWYVRINRKCYLVHRVVYFLENGVIPDHLEIDHIDRDRNNNSRDNLRIVTHAVNMRNTSLQVNNQSGVTGVNYKEIFDKRKNYLYKGWRAEWRDENGKNCTKLFSVRKYGYDEAFRLACDHRTAMIHRLVSIGLMYSDTHGT
jgi:hypothetical protein